MLYLRQNKHISSRKIISEIGSRNIMGKFFKKLFAFFSYQSHKSHNVVSSIKEEKKCYICGNIFDRFSKFDIGFESMPIWFEKLDWVGSDLENFSCPYCGCNDRERHLFMFFDKLDFWSKFTDKNIIHFAPEPFLSERIIKQFPAFYVKVDLNPSDESIQKGDITNIQYKDKHFDILICNHVLEHVPDYVKALNEINRILKKGGIAILQTPYSRMLQRNFEDKGINTDELRLIYYGQADHVRFFSEKHLFESIKQSGLDLNLISHKDFFLENETSYYGVNEKEDLILVIKPNK